MATEALSFPKLSPPLKLYSHKAFSSIEALLPKLSLPLKIWALSHESMAWYLKVWVWCLKEWISLGSRMVSQKKLLMFEDLGFLWVWEWFHKERYLCLKLWVSRYLGIKFWFSLYLWGFEGVVSFVFVNRNLILSDFDWDWK